MPRTIALIYLLFGALWIFFTDRLLVWMHLDADRILQLQTSKGWLFVIGSAVLLYVLLRRYEKRDAAAKAALVDSQREGKQMNAELEQRVTERTRQLEAANRELESFAYAVSHDLRAPLRSMSGFSQILRESAPAGLDDKSKHYLQRIHEASQRMSSLIEDLLGLSRISRSELNPRPVNLSQVAHEAAAALRERHPERPVQLEIAPDMAVQGDARLLRIAMDNLLANAWKYTSRAAQPRIAVGMQHGDQGPVYFVRDNGVGFDMAYAHKLFVPFQRLHPEAEFAGSGIGLVTIQRILARHGGRIWTESAPDQGATFFFTLHEPGAIEV
jgi:light-regulated signal transduction histidine kinase (bacteriophytochrome)